MPSNIDSTIPVSGTLADAVPIRANFAAAKQEIEALQSAGAVTLARRFDIDAPRQYLGTAPAGSSESDDVWTILRLDFSAGLTTATATLVAWSDRASVTYA